MRGAVAPPSLPAPLLTQARHQGGRSQPQVDLELPQMLILMLSYKTKSFHCLELEARRGGAAVKRDPAPSPEASFPERRNKTG